ncbi:MAG: hypothetical protein MI920_21255 [Kiloniellales bacterium]|nr:hypothetical protein [Kiloniellales bacterium]
MRRVLLAAGFLAVASFSGQAAAQAPPSGGELSQVFACFYECKPGPVVQGVPTWQAITTLMVMNMNSGVPDPVADTRLVNVIFVDGNENILGSSRGPGLGLNLSPEDLDELNVCRTLQANGLPVPQAGIVEFYVAGGDPGGVYAWVQNLIGKFFVTVDEPFAGRVTGIAKTECRQVPLEVSTPMEIAQKAIASGAPQDVQLILVEDTDE